MSSGEKKYTVREERLNAASHFAGFLLLVAGMSYLFSRPLATRGPMELAAALFYGISLLFMFGISGLYHSSGNSRWRKIFRELDHCAIYFLITGSYAPLLCKVSPDRTGAIIFALLSGLSVAGSAGRFLNIGGFKKIEIILYIAMGWCCVAIAGKLFRMLSPTSLWLLAAGGICYTAGVVFYVKRREFFHAVWHLFVSAGATLQFFAITGAMNL